MPPTKDISDDENRRSASIDDPENEHDGAETDNATIPGAAPATNDPLAMPSGVINTLRSGLRNLTFGSASRQESDTHLRDLEHGLGTEPIAA